MLALLADPPLEDAGLAYEPKYDGIRALAFVHGTSVRLWSRLGNEKAAQFPEIAGRLAHFGALWKRPVLLDGEIVALDSSGEAVGFQHLQARIHLTGRRDVERAISKQPTALMVFDLLRNGDRDLRALPFAERRKQLERLMGRRAGRLVRLTPIAYGRGADLLEQVRARGWEGLIAKDVGSPYLSGRRTPAWRKLKIVHEQEFVIGGWTEPRQTRQHFGALLLGVYAAPSSFSTRGGRLPPSLKLRRTAVALAEAGQPAERPPKGGHYVGHEMGSSLQPLIYVGSVGTGFTDAELARVAARLKKLETRDCPFDAPPSTLERSHWVSPLLVAQVKFSEWTADGKLRAPVYLGLRDDVRPGQVVREDSGIQDSGFRIQERSGIPDSQFSNPESRIPNPKSSVLHSLIAHLQDLEERRRDGILDLPGGIRLNVTNLQKIFWPELGITKGELLRHYVRVSPYILPAVADRPLVMKRFPNGIHAKAFYQQRAPDEVPKGVRVEMVQEDSETMPRFVGGSLATLLYMTQLAAISQDPWFSRVQTPDHVDYVALDLDPQPGVEFAQVLDVARWIGEILHGLGTPSIPKTSGSRGLHIYMPMPPGTTYESGMLFCQIVATVVAARHPKAATVERAVAARGRTVYVDYLQNIRGKTLATAYSARATAFAGVSAPLTWKEVAEGVDPRDFTLKTIESRMRAVGDLWARLRTSKPSDPRAVLRLK